MPGLLDRVSSKSTVSREYKCTVQLLDDAQTLTVDFKKHDLGQVVLDYVCDMLNIVEKDYFGLRYVDTNRHRYWLDTTKPVLRQVKSSSIVFAFRVKFYPSDPTVVKEELTRYMMAFQLKRDLLHGRLYCPQSDAAVLGGYILQGDVGDYDPQEHPGNYVSEYKLFLNQTPKLEEKIALEHQKLRGRGLTPADADQQFLKKACLLDTYGYYPYTIKDPKHGQVYMGATPRGVLVYQTHRKLHHLKWDDIKDFDYVGKDFFVHTKPEYFIDNNIEDNNDDQTELNDQKDNNGDNRDRPYDQNATDHSKNSKKSALRFTCPSATFCKHLWKYMLAQQAFFTKHRSNEVKPIAIRRGLLFRRSTFRYSGRVLQEIKEAPSPKRAEPSFERTHLQRQMPRDERSAPWANKFHTLPRATKPESSESKGLLVSNEAPDSLVMTKENLLLDTTAQPTPDVTPLSGLSPSSVNGDLSDSMITSPIVSSTTANSSVNGGTYKEDTITVSLKQVEPSLVEGGGGGTSWDKQPLSTNGPTVNQTVTVKRGIVRQRNGSPPVTSTDMLKYENAGVVDDGSAPKRAVPRKGRSGGGGVCRVLVKTIIGGLMFTILLIGTVIVVMEIQNQQFREYVRQIPGEDTFRHEYYHPARQRAMEYYQRTMATGQNE